MNTTRYLTIADDLLRRNGSGTSDHYLSAERKAEIHHIMILLTALIGGFAAGAAYLLGDAIPTTVTPEVQAAIKQAMSIMDDGRLRTVCIIGSMGGGILSVLLYPLGSPKQLAGKIFGSAISGMMFSPSLIEWFGWQPTTDRVLGISGVVSLLSWTLLQIAIPLTGDWFTRKFKAIEPS